MVTHVTGPPEDSDASPRRFYRGTAGLQATLDEYWREGIYYLGEWHCHPGGPAEPSQQDVTQLRQIAGSKSYNCPEPILVIVGIVASAIQMAAFVFPARSDTVSLGCMSLEGPAKQG